MSPDPSFAELMARLQSGDESAARQVFDRFAARLIGLARTRLHPLLRAKVDAEEVMQSVLKSFFHRHADGQFALRDWDNLWGLLVVITLRKCGRLRRQFQGAHRDIRREANADAASDWQLADSEPTPDEAVLLTETVERLLNGFDERDRGIVELALQGCEVAEISDQVRRSQRTVQRVLQRVRQRLERMRAEDVEDA